MKRNRRYRWDTGLRFRVLGLLVFLLSLLVLLGAVLAATFSQLESVQQTAEKTRQNVMLMEQATGSFTEMTSALRGYLLTGQEPVLEPYNTATASLQSTLAQLRAASANSPDELNRIDQIDSLVRIWQEQVALPEIAARRAARPDSGSLLASLGVNYVDQVKAAGVQYINSEQNRLHTELESASQAEESVQRATWLGVGIAAVAALIGFIVFARSVTRATGALAAAAEAIGRGERGVVVDVPLDGELQEVAEAFSAMSMTLAAQTEELQAQQDELQERAEALEEQDRRLSRLNRFGQALIGTIELHQLSQLILDEYLDLYQGAGGVLLLADQHSNELIVQAERWLKPTWVGTRTQPAGPLARCVELSEVVIVRYPETASRMPLWQTEVPVVQETYIPLVHANRVIAVVMVAALAASEPSDEARSLWSGVARQSAVALAAATNHEEVKRGLLMVQEQAAQVEELNAQLEEERDRASAQLDIYLSIVSTMPSGAWLTDTAGNLLVANSTFREYFGDLFEGANLDQTLAQLATVLEADDPFLVQTRALVNSLDQTGEGRIRLSNGYELQWSSAPVGKGHDLVGRLFIFQDVTELANLDRLKSEFVNTVSHELRTPLTSIMGYLSLVLNEQVGPLAPQQKEFLGVVVRNTDRLATLINDLLDVQRIESGGKPMQHKPVQLSYLANQVAETFRVAAQQKGLQFEVTPPATDMPTITADPERLTQVASNLISNAVKYTRHGYVRVSTGTTGRSIYLTVEDSGIGIPPAEQKKVFEKFYRGENRYAREAGGTGLGLSLVKLMVEEHGGEIKVESTPGKGSKFTVTFPLDC